MRIPSSKILMHITRQPAVIETDASYGHEEIAESVFPPHMFALFMSHSLTGQGNKLDAFRW
jgi:hypothetical protein